MVTECSIISQVLQFFRFSGRCRFLFCLVLPAILLLTSCHGGQHDNVSGGTGSSGAVTTVVSGDLQVAGLAMNTLHFPTFEVAAPSAWTERGNTVKVYESESADRLNGCFLLAGPVSDSPEGETGQAAFEACIAGALELFFNTEFTKGRVSFSYDRFDTPENTKSMVAGLTRVTGTLANGRTGDTLWFAGLYSEQPDAVVVYFARTPENFSVCSDLMEASYESFRAL